MINFVPKLTDYCCDILQKEDEELMSIDKLCDLKKANTSDEEKSDEEEAIKRSSDGSKEEGEGSSL